MADVLSMSENMLISDPIALCEHSVRAFKHARAYNMPRVVEIRNQPAVLPLGVRAFKRTVT